MPPQRCRDKAKPSDGFTTQRFRLRRATPDSESRQSAELPSRREGSESSARVSIPACDRCRRLKKRCSRALPECGHCVHAGQRCSYSGGLGPSAGAYRILQERVNALTRYIVEVMGREMGDVEREIGIVDDGDGAAPEELKTGERDEAPFNKRDTPAPDAIAANSHVDVIPQTALVEAFFHHVYRAYPFIDKTRILHLSSLGLKPNVQDGDSIILHIIMAIGHTSLQRSGKAPYGVSPAFEISYSDILQRCFLHEDIDSIQILVLLALYSLFDPLGPSTWSIVGIITRQAMTQGLTRSTNESQTNSKTTELRRRLVWSIFVLDRMMAVSVGQAPGLASDEMEVPYPAITVEEFASPDRTDLATMLQVSRHVIELRQLESRILSTVHLQSRTNVSNLSLSDRNAITSRFRADVENWYSHGCLIARPEPDNVRLHDTMAWLNARYYHLMLVLYYPCQFNSRAKGSQEPGLLPLVRKFMQYNQVLLANRQLPLNRVTLCRLAPICLILIHCFSWGCYSSFPGKGDVRTCIDILRTFSDKWEMTRTLIQVLTEFEDLISDYEASLMSQADSLHPCAMNPSHQDWLRSVWKSLSDLLGKIMGKTSCYLNILEDWNTQAPEPSYYPRAGPESPVVVSPSSSFSPHQGYHFSFL
ncbi:hypothetical protein P170DRAFT_438335 [Aspergillus steynii IBT 23096]|uniref:Zn(2)-C6 fungal-type domain-containing protein n=1 Tax=Aspergillus steynii IBT 23096 TaxID=1392250 RepID=A0A2I2G170_9EURO|nr:uncharacterized protein P170DRAFT_438335 [Aspergillus steynii IBT 23096]PLB46622.1 hypothetical protein P170DRAFT_438335 [Aspergillus steynii IBT 23096]